VCAWVLVGGEQERGTGSLFTNKWEEPLRTVRRCGWLFGILPSVGTCSGLSVATVGVGATVGMIVTDARRLRRVGPAGLRTHFLGGRRTLFLSPKESVQAAWSWRELNHMMSPFLLGWKWRHEEGEGQEARRRRQKSMRGAEKEGGGRRGTVGHAAVEEEATRSTGF